MSISTYFRPNIHQNGPEILGVKQSHPLCKNHASMAMQSKAWMTSHLFKAWIGHFVKNVKDFGFDISPLYSHLLILDAHRSHVTFNVVKIICSIK
jgi:hypothetical protein